MDDKQLAMVLTAITQGFERVAKAIESAREAQADDVIEAALGDFKTFDWSAIGATVVQRDDDGPALIRAANGKLCKRRSKDKFGDDIWFNYPDGKDSDGNVIYRRVIHFKEIKDAEPLSRKIEKALSNAKPSQPAPDPVVKSAAALGGTARPAAAQPDPLRVAALNALNLVINEAVLEGVELTSATKPQDGDDVATLNMRATTLRNLIDAKKRSGAPPMTTAPATPEPAPAGDVTRGEGVAMKLQSMSKQLGTRSSTPAQDEQTVAALEALCGGEAGRRQFTDAVFRKAAYKQLLPSQRLAIFQWLRPIGHGAEARTSNEHAAGSVRDVLAYAKTLQAVPA
jgi:hypothetical protein